ncbi:hypothetical protein J6590_092523 [Homalodisca vitripennis]|nr:hypothetical protein J6590_092523 [Homalodisca vitripennis]
MSGKGTGIECQLSKQFLQESWEISFKHRSRREWSVVYVNDLNQLSAVDVTIAFTSIHFKKNFLWRAY